LSTKSDKDYYAQRNRSRRIWEQNKYQLKGALIWDYWLLYHKARGLSSKNLGTYIAGTYIAGTTIYIPILNYVQATINSNETGMDFTKLHTSIPDGARTPRR